MSFFTFHEYRFSYIFLMIYLMTFLYLRYSWKKTFGIAFLSVVLTTIIEYERFMAPVPHITSQVVSTLLQIVIVQLTALAMAKYRDFRAIFVSFSCATYVIAGNVFGSMIFHKTKDAGLGLLVCVLVDILNYLILHRLLRRPVILEQKRRQDGWMFMCIVPALFYLVELVLFIQQIRAYDSPGIVIAGVLVLVIMAVSYRLETMIWLGQERDNRLLRDKEVMETYSSSLEKELAARHMADDRTAMMRHDMRHYVAMIASLMSEKKYEEVVEVLKDMNGRLDESTPKKYCTNVYLNAVLAQYDDLTKAEGIAFSVKMETPDNLQISTIDLASTISNLLNNAVNGCRKISNETERVIKIRSHVVKNQFMVEVSNTFNGVIHLDEESGLPLSDGGSEHGYGMRSVSAFAEKNGGMFDFSVEDNKFYARLLLPLQNL